MKRVLLLVGLCISLASNAQLFTDSFTDGTFATNPAWTTTDVPAQYAVVGSSAVGPGAIGSNTLRLGAGGGTGGQTAYISTQNTVGWGTFQAWSFWVGRNSTTSSANQSYVWLFATEANVGTLSATIDGYRIAFGDNTGVQEVRLERIVNGVVNATIMQAASAIPAAISDYGFRIRITRNASNQWQIFTGVSLAGLTTGGGEAANANPYNVTGNGAALTGEVGTPVPIAGTGYFALAALHGGSGPERQGAEFDQFNFQLNGLLPVSITSFTALKKDNKALLNWEVADEKNVDVYEVERSANGVQFSNIGYVKASGSPSYSFTDQKILNGVNFYRVKNVDIDGKFAYTHVVSINGKTGRFLTMFPIPARTDLYIQHHEALNGAQLRLTSMEGRIVKVMKVPPNSTQTVLDISTLQSGVYYLTYDSGDGEKFTSRFMKQ